ncbi:hypothetical protein [Ralstonia soli]|uniref:Uncharacterized protein n=1 Tax=Ralstonia soli TaxID=2953896 RepID=A0ABT1AMR4_9RALS|nr:hypothetical protein [Ralstonia soli]MCO5399504.1 hypothetical protein [Ralstonia soli]
MPATTLKHLLVTSTLMFVTTAASALTTSPAAFSDQELQAMLAHSKPAQSAKRTEPVTRQRLHVGLSDPNTQLVLPWFLADLVDAVNQRTSPQDVAKKLRDGI